MAGPAIMHQRIAAAYGLGDNLLPANADLLMRLGQSPEYNAIRDRVTGPWPLDSWQEDDLHYFVLELRPLEDEMAGQEAPTAVFTMHPASHEPVAAVVVTPSASDAQAEVMDLRQAGQSYVAPIPASA